MNSGEEAMSTFVEAREVRRRWSELLEKVEEGEDVTITRHRMPVAKLVPVKKKASLDEREAAVARIRKLRLRLSLERSKIKAMIAEGRK